MLRYLLKLSVPICSKVNNCMCSLLQVFGLGNKTYEHYNEMGHYVDKRLDQLGANRIFELGLGDDDAKYVKVHITCVCNVLIVWFYLFFHNTKFMHLHKILKWS